MANLDHFNGSFTANAQTFTFDTISNTGAYVQFSGTYAGVTVNFEGTVDGGTTWVPIMGYPVSVAGVGANSVVLTTNQQVQYYLLVGACQQTRIRVSAYTSGTAVVGVLTVLDADPIQATSVAGGSTAVSNFSAAAATADGATGPSTTTVYSDSMMFNGATWDRERNNTTGIVVDASAAKTVTGNGVTATNFNAHGAHVFVNITAASGTTPTLVVKLQGSVDGTNFYDLDATNATTASLTGISTAVIRIYPGLTNAVGTANQVLPRIWRCVFTIGGTTPSFTVATTVAYIL